ncbi:MAG: hypothetical protein ACXAEU_17165 [Candidatus Hodarchaeales archaeon]|jgi:hypothetical protein
MAVFVEAITEPFEGARDAMAEGIKSEGRTGYPVRRPTRGYQLKPNTYAIIRVMGGDGKFIPVFDAGGEFYSAEESGQMTSFYSNFFVQSVAEERHEKSQVVQTFGDSFIFFFGESPRMLNVNGLLLNTADFNWRAEFWENYNTYFRGTKLVERGARLYLIYDDVIAEGYMVGANAQESAEPAPSVIPFSFQIFLTGYTNISKIGDPNFPQPEGAIDYAQLTSYDLAIQNWQKSRNLQREMYHTAVEKARLKSYRLGTIKMLADGIRSAIMTGTIPNAAGLVTRAALTIKGLGADKLGGLITGGPQQIRPMRTVFTDNIDEYMHLPEPSAGELGAPLSMHERWMEMDQAVEFGLLNILSIAFSFTSPPFFDMMGRGGRANSQMRRGGGTPGVSGGILAGPALPGGPPGMGRTGPGPQRRGNMQSRAVPFGMMRSSGAM